MSFHSIFKGNQSKNRMDPEIASQLFPIRQTAAEREQGKADQKAAPLVKKILSAPPEAPKKGSLANIIIAIVMVAIIGGVVAIVYIKKIGPFAETPISQ